MFCDTRPLLRLLSGTPAEMALRGRVGHPDACAGSAQGQTSTAASTETLLQTHCLMGICPGISSCHIKEDQNMKRIRHRQNHLAGYLTILSLFLLSSMQIHA